jgi:hypothetical protein
LAQIDSGFDLSSRKSRHWISTPISTPDLDTGYGPAIVAEWPEPSMASVHRTEKR